MEFRSITGQGVTGTLDHHSAGVGNRKLMGALVGPSAVAVSLDAIANDLQSQRQTVVFVAWEGAVIGVLGVADPSLGAERTA